MLVHSSQTTMSPDLIALISQYGLAIVFANVLVEQIGLPIPAIPMLVVAGALGAAGQLSLPLVFIVALLACLIADSTWYIIGRIYGNSVMKTLCRISLTPDSCVSETQSRFERWGVNALMVAKFVPGLSLIAPPLAGATRIGVPTFLLFNGIGASLWVLAGISGGALFGKQVEFILAQVQQYGTMAVIAIVALLATYIGYKWLERHRFYAALRMARISVDDLYRLIEGGSQPVVVDVRSHIARSLQPRRIPGALLVPPDAVEGHVKDLPRDRDIILYCTCPNEASAANAAKVLMNHGFTRVRPLHGGLDAWIDAGYAVDVLVDVQPTQVPSNTETMQV
jgi:membrane protein DedA with SNARE-associated domain/rhodanese-related sulfurtransferase